jgi:serine/threonine protein kinase
VILVNLTCGRNPWKQASVEDSTYRAYTRNQDFLKTILPLSDELNDVLGRIFTRNPEQRITLSELRIRILACPRFTIQPGAATIAPLPTPPASREASPEYVDCEDTIVDDYDDDEYDDVEDDYDSPASSVSDEEEGSDCASDDGSLTSSGSSIDDLDEEFILEQQQQHHQLQHHQQQQQQQQYQHCQQDLWPHGCPSPPIYEEDARAQLYAAAAHEYHMQQQQQQQQYTGPVPVQVPVQEPMVVHMPVPVSAVPVVPVQAPLHCAPQKPPAYFSFWWGDVNKFMQHAPTLHPHVPFHHQVPLFAALQGCY